MSRLMRPRRDNRPSFFEPLIQPRDPVEIVRNFLLSSPSGTFKHSDDVSKKVMKELNCRCERISNDTCVYSKDDSIVR
jgi:hypothetical protein